MQSLPASQCAGMSEWCASYRVCALGRKVHLIFHFNVCPTKRRVASEIVVRSAPTLKINDTNSFFSEAAKVSAERPGFSKSRHDVQKLYNPRCRRWCLRTRQS